MRYTASHFERVTKAFSTFTQDIPVTFGIPFRYFGDLM